MSSQCSLTPVFTVFDELLITMLHALVIKVLHDPCHHNTPWTWCIVITGVLEHCEYKGMEHCDDKGIKYCEDWCQGALWWHMSWSIVMTMAGSTVMPSVMEGCHDKYNGALWWLGLEALWWQRPLSIFMTRSWSILMTRSWSTVMRKPWSLVMIYLMEHTDEMGHGALWL